MFDVIEAPKVSREAVVEHYGEEFAKIFEECDSCIGIALDYVNDIERTTDMSAKEYALIQKERYTSVKCLTTEITMEEYANSWKHRK